MGRSGFHGLPVLATALVGKVRETVKGGIKGVGFLAGGYIEKMKQTANYRNLIHIRDRDLRTARSEPPARVCHQLVPDRLRGTLISDWYPTILDATGCSIPSEDMIHVFYYDRNVQMENIVFRNIMILLPTSFEPL